MTFRSILSASLPALGQVYRRFKDSFPAVPLGRTFRFGGQSISTLLQSHSIQQRANRASATDLDWMDGVVGGNGGWARTEYGDYYVKAVSVYAAVKLRAEALTRPPLIVHRKTPEGLSLPVGSSHPLQQVLDQVNPWFTRGDLWRATEIYLNLWGSAFWALERDEHGRWQIWPLRPDRVNIIPDKEQYIKGVVYTGRNGPVAYTTNEILWLRYFNPLEEYAGLSPLAPARMSVDMGLEGLRSNRNFLRNSARPDFVLLTNDSMTDMEIEEFYNRWEALHRGPGNANRPAIASFVRDIKTLGFSHRDMDFDGALRKSAGFTVGPSLYYPTLSGQLSPTSTPPSGSSGETRCCPSSDSWKSSSTGCYCPDSAIPIWKSSSTSVALRPRGKTKTAACPGRPNFWTVEY